MSDDVEVAQKLNAQRLLQTLNEGILNAPTPAKAAVQVVRLYTVLAPVRAIDGAFEDDWGNVLDGRLQVIVGYPRGLMRLQWTHINAAHEALLNLMERHGMGFQATVPDATEQELASLEANNQGRIQDDALPTGASLETQSHDGLAESEWDDGGDE
jgi:hypothetical protein